MTTEDIIVLLEAIAICGLIYYLCKKDRPEIQSEAKENKSITDSPIQLPRVPPNSPNIIKPIAVPVLPSVVEECKYAKTIHSLRDQGFSMFEKEWYKITFSQEGNETENDPLLNPSVA